MIKYGAGNIQRFNPDWNVVVYDENDIEQYIKSKVNKEVFETMKDGHLVEKSDLFRLLKMYHEGGIYVDIDRVFNANLSDIVLPETRMLLPTNYDVNFMQDSMGTAKNNRLFKKMIDERTKVLMTGGPKNGPLERRDGLIREEDVMRMGPGMFNAVIFKELFNRTVTMPEAREAISAISPVIMTKKDVWCDGLFVTPFEGCKAVSRQPLYDMYGLVHWTKKTREAWKVGE
jgi:hypothetical protein